MTLTRISYCVALLLLAGCTADSRAPEKTTPVPSTVAQSGSSSADSNAVSVPATTVAEKVRRAMSAEEILDSIRILGADSVVQLYYDDRLSDSIQTGHPRWLAVAERIAPGTDASTGEALSEDVRDALPNAPGPVLRFLATSLSPAYSFDASCSGEGDFGDERTVAAARAKLIVALKSVDDPSLTGLRDACLTRAKGQAPCVPPARGGCSVGWPRLLGRDASVDSIWRAIDAGGAPAGLRRMVQSYDTLPALYRERLAAGDEPWLPLAAVVLAAAETTMTMRDGRSAMWPQYAIVDALSDALMVKPRSVLDGITRYPTFGLGWLCGYDLAGSTIDTATKRVRRDRMAAALATVTQRELVALRDACAVRVLVPVR